ncbi:uncharacterized protein LOC144859355 isoform X2 [Branchiostoma floridae x Branchiostoma japonicum]
MEDGIDLGLDDLDADFGSGGSGGKRPTESAWDSDDELLNDDTFGATKRNKKKKKEEEELTRKTIGRNIVRFKADQPEEDDEFDEEALLGDSDEEGDTTQNTSQESQSSQEIADQSQEEHNFAESVDPGEISINVSQESDFYGSEVEGQSGQYEDVIDISIGDTEGLEDLEVDTDYTTGSQQSHYRSQPQATTQHTTVTTVHSEEQVSSHEEQITETEAHTEHDEADKSSESESEEEEEEEEDEEDTRRGRFKSERVETSGSATTAPSKISLSKVNKPNREIPDTLEVSEDVQKQIEEFEQQKMMGRRGRGFRGGRGGRGSMPQPRGQGFRPRPLLQGQHGPRPLMSQPRFGPRGGGYGPRGPPGPRGPGPGPLLRSPPGQLAPRKVLINPHFKGTVQARPEAPLRWDRDTMHHLGPSPMEGQHQPYQPPPHEGHHQPPPPRGQHQHPPPGGQPHQPRPQGGQYQPPPHRGPQQFQEPRPRMAPPMGGHRPPSSGPPSWQGNRPQQGHNRQEQFGSGPQFEGHQQHKFQPRPLLDLPPQSVPHSHPPHHSQPPPHQSSSQYPPHSQPPPRYPPHSQSQPPQHHPPHSQMSQHQPPQHFQHSNPPPHSQHQSYTPFSQQPPHIPTHTHNAPHQSQSAPPQSHNPPRPFNPPARPAGFQQRPSQLNQPRPRMQSPPPRQPSPQQYRHGNPPGNQQRLPMQAPAPRPQVTQKPAQREQHSPRAFPQGEQQPMAARPNLREIPQVGELPPPQPAAMRKKKMKVQKRLGPPVSQQQQQPMSAEPDQPTGEEDEETRKLRAKIAEQKRLREEIQRRKELRRQQLAGSRKAELMKRVAAQKAAANQEENQGGQPAQDFGAQPQQTQEFNPGVMRTQPPPPQRIPVQQQAGLPHQPPHMQPRMNTPRQNLQKVQGFAKRVPQGRPRMPGPQSALQPVPQAKTFQPRAQNIPQRMQLGQNRTANGQVSPMKPQEQPMQSAPARLHVKQRLGLGRGKANMQMSGGQQNQPNAQRMVTLAGQHQPPQTVIGRGQPIRTVTSQQPVQTFDVGANGDQPHVKMRVVQGPQGGGLQQQPTQMASSPQGQPRKRIVKLPNRQQSEDSQIGQQHPQGQQGNNPKRVVLGAARGRGRGRGRGGVQTRAAAQQVSQQPMGGMMSSHVVAIDNLSMSTSEDQLRSMLLSVGPVEKMDLLRTQKKAIAKFAHPEHAADFQRKFHRHMVDLSHINVSLMPE